MPCPKPQVWCTIINCSSQHTKVLPVLKRSQAHTSLHMLEPFAGIAPGLLEKCALARALPYSQEKRGQICKRLAHFAGWGVELAPLPPHSPVFQYAVHLAEPLKDFPPGMWLILLWETEWIIVQVFASQTSTGNNLFFIHDISCKRYCYVNVSVLWHTFTLLRFCTSMNIHKILNWK